MTIGMASRTAAERPGLSGGGVGGYNGGRSQAKELSVLNPAVRQWIDDHHEPLLDDLKQLLRFPSVANAPVEKGHVDPCRGCALWLVDRLAEMGFDARLLEARGKPNVLAERHVDDARPTVLIYGHYDVQPPDPLEPWESAPFEPTIRDGAIYARGANDNKGQFWAHLCAIRAWQAAGGGLPVNVKVFLEGEEEIGSPHLDEFLQAHREQLAADVCLVSDSEFFDAETPSIAYSLRGVAAYEVVFRGPSADIHSGVNGGAVTNPINALARCVAALHDDAGRVMLPGFYDRVVELTDAERDAWRALAFDESAYARDLGVDALGGGESGYSVLERRWGRPTLDANGIVGGYTQAGSKTIIPAEARVKLSVRLVPDQQPGEILAALRRFVADHTPPGIRSEVTAFGAGRAVMFRTDSPAMEAGKSAMAEAFGRRPALIRCGASVPVTEMIQRILGIDAVMMGYGLPDDRIHSPNERFRLSQLWGGAVATASFLQAIAQNRS